MGLLLAAGCRCDRKAEPKKGAVPTKVDRPKPRPPPYMLGAVASSGDTTLVAFRGDGGVQAVRLDASGKVLDRPPLRLSRDRHDADVAVAATGSGFWVAWERFGKAVDIRGVRVSTSGNILDRTAVVLTGPSGTQRSPRIACGAVDCMLTYTEHDNGSYGGLRALRISEGSARKPVQVITEEQRSSDLVAVPKGYLIVFSAGLGAKRNDISTTFVPEAANAAPSTSKRIAKAERGSSARIACGPKGCYAAWLRKVRVKGGPRHKDVQGMRVYVTPTRSEIWGVALELDGTVTDGATPAKLRDLETGTSAIEILTLGAMAGGFMLAWEATAYDAGKPSFGVLQVRANSARALTAPILQAKNRPEAGPFSIAFLGRSRRQWLLAPHAASRTDAWVVQRLTHAPSAP